MSASHIVQAVLLAVVVLSCWLGAVGAWRMREPVQGLHFCTLSAAIGMGALVVAVFVALGNTSASWKTVLIYLILLVVNSVGTHATARAFRARELGHWQPRDGDPFEWVGPDEEAPPQEVSSR